MIPSTPFKKNKYLLVLSVSALLLLVSVHFFARNGADSRLSDQAYSIGSGSGGLDLTVKWELCRGPTAVDYMPCLDNFEAIKKLKSRKHMEAQERHCPVLSSRCLPPLPNGYKVAIPWPKSRDMVCFLL